MQSAARLLVAVTSLNWRIKLNVGAVAILAFLNLLMQILLQNIKLIPFV